jgi:hypothetical protein
MYFQNDAENYAREYKVAKSLGHRWDEFTDEQKTRFKDKFEPGPPLINEVQTGFLDVS